jgi:transposase
MNSIEGLLEAFNVRTCEALPSLYMQQARYHTEQALLLDRQIKEIERTLRPQLRREIKLYRLGCLPGFGEIVAATVLLEVGEISRFPKDRQFFSYSRLVPGAENSGGRTRHRSGHKAGNRYLKLAFSHAAVRAIQHYPEIRSFYQRKGRKKPPRVARTLVAKELARIAYYILRNEEDFDGRFKGQPLSRQKTPPWPRPAGPERKLDEKQD